MKHTRKHPGFDAAAAHIAATEGVPIDQARAMLASGTRLASKTAKKHNPRLLRVKGGK
jgi:hypothetical protein